MSLPLTEEMREALEAHPDIPLHLRDEKTNTDYVVLRADAYERVKALFEEAPLSRDEQLDFLQVAEPAGMIPTWTYTMNSIL